MSFIHSCSLCGSQSAASKTPAPIPSRQADSDSDSEYGARSKKKKKPRIPDDGIRVSSRGVKVPNYFDDVKNFEDFEDDVDSGYYVAEPGVQYEEEHEIEGVFYHMRDEDRKNDPEDLWHDNIVRLFLHLLLKLSF